MIRVEKSVVKVYAFRESFAVLGYTSCQKAESARIFLLEFNQVLDQQMTLFSPLKS